MQAGKVEIPGFSVVGEYDFRMQGRMNNNNMCQLHRLEAGKEVFEASLAYACSPTRLG